MYIQTTESIVVTVNPQFASEESVPNSSYYIWTYHVEIRNEGNDMIQLVNRHWHITDARGQVKEVHGEGVVGLQPILEPGEGFEYTSYVPLTTPSGMMSGAYEMRRPGGSLFNVMIPTFSLDSPEHTPSLN